MSHIESIHSIAARRWKVAITLSVLMLAIYLGFILLVAFGKPWLSILLGPGLSVGILLGALTIFSCWILSIIYVVWANLTASRGATCVSCEVACAAWASWQGSGDRDHQPSMNGRDRVGNVPFGPDRGRRGVGNCWKWQVS